MVKTWDSAAGDNATCPKCGSVYSVTVHRYPATDQGKFDCEVCGERIKTWKSTYDYEFHLKTRGTPPAT
jgi:transcription elongation factor Elf1